MLNTSSARRGVDRGNKTEKTHKSVGEEQIGEKEREAETWGEKVKAATKQYKFCKACTYTSCGFERDIQLISNRRLGKTATHLPTITHMRYIPGTISPVSFVLISFQDVASLLHSPALMRHNADNIYSMSLPRGHASTI